MPLVFVDPAYTSQTCAQCGHVDKRNRVDQGLSSAGGAGRCPHRPECSLRARSFRAGSS
ncbi:zinc ribbon domain-containing protein [Streptomyces canus]|uniref:zinc ribbon domain-containing protein n=1 Tax=Streptomyces canus TaxID=58343 RepID=UPI003F5420C1